MVAEFIHLKKYDYIVRKVKNFFWGHSSAGRAPAWHAGGQEFESPWLHQYFLYLI